MIGTANYNKDDQNVGSVDDVIAGQNGQLQVIVATNNKKSRCRGIKSSSVMPSSTATTRS
jgi:hypothetical protein